VPWLDLISIDCLTFLVTLMPTIDMGIPLEPSDISLVVLIGYEVIFIGRIEYIDGKPELVF
jgi:hypothetical protein